MKRRSVTSATLLGAHVALTCFLASTFRAQASPSDAALCEEAAHYAARTTGVPREVLTAITLTETGRRSEGGPMRPWPWAVNLQGEGHWFRTRRDAEQFAQDALRQGLENFDVGCFQLNHKWHASAFRGLETMFDPRENALYAARYLMDLRHGSEDWSSAAGAYHSATPEYAQRYRARFDMLLADLSAGDLDVPSVVRVNLNPLFRIGSARSTGSLVPLDGSPRPMFGSQ
ncbi:transglycosylase SLT domain-containing protein [Rhodobacter sp. NSM]|uniref:transglycosylase SLT domain-containing protein n=1 Tax=Rhodobacter sp. NSM TaxID=3457501 RepID=UPI003FD4DAE9